MKKQSRIIKIIMFLAVVVIACIVFAGCEQEKQFGADEQQKTIAASEQPTMSTYTFRCDDYLMEHYEKHGREMGFDSPEEYLKAANAVISSPDSLMKNEAEDGDQVYYLESTNEFVVLSTDGYIRTYFNPSDGIDYFNRQ